MNEHQTVKAERRPSPKSTKDIVDMDVVRVPVFMEMQVGELVFDRSGRRSIVSAALVCVADFINTEQYPGNTVPMKFFFRGPGGDRFSIVIDVDQ